MGSAIARIRPGLFVGSLMSLRKVRQYKVSHVLSVTKDAPGIEEMFPGCSYKQYIVQVDDKEEENLLVHFETCISFIKEGLSEEDGVVLVHCIAGVSRSTTVIAAYLMATEGLDADTAIATITALRPVTDPNKGFRQQLKVWEEMGSSYDSAHAYVKARELEALGEKLVSGDSIDQDKLAKPSDTEDMPKVILYRCRMCRCLVATSANAAPQYLVKQANSDSPTFSGKRSRASSGATQREATQLFVEPMQWMKEAFIGDVQGKLYCSGCKARIGSFNWSGMQNSKGDWVSPAFELQLSKLDAMSTQPSEDKIRKPTLL